ncbi:hypothetical protein [Desulfitobacterium chlororespirans]|uniref:Chemotaxis protein n=1 Tax=Desulfitobacterium chlororespirans DSM 11544 TaxID=1121395 RepID=A0A1M7RW55_9FIRM|nr:hypothetical protein [Desulfitobacterium chlororespirans]SHN50597.1 hypothetical protein SAMN02745215_00203 [Desulfitobacterium chlororespirans DSM 11544]
MKLIIKQYLASLKERSELDAILPDLLSQLGLIVFSRPGRGTRQDGVDVAAVGNLDGKGEKVYLLSIKQGDLTRNSWDGEAIQALRPSLNEILDSYIPNRMPSEHKNKEIVICLCFGGDIKEQVRPQVEGYIKKNMQNNISFEEWNGDKLASMILEGFLREELLPNNARSQLRKSLALLDEPVASYKHFSTLIFSLTSIQSTKENDQLMVIRQINICLWILFVWAREAGNLESAYLSCELALLHSWEISKGYIPKTTKSAEAIQTAFASVLSLYQQITIEYLEKILPHANKLHALSVAVRPSSDLDVNLKLFDILGRVALGGIWVCWNIALIGKNYPEMKRLLVICLSSIRQLIRNNPTLFLPTKDDQAIDISLAVLLLSVSKRNVDYIVEWLSEIADRAEFAYLTYQQYPCNLQNYSELLERSQKHEEAFRKEITKGSILYPMIALWAALFGETELYNRIQNFKQSELNHCTFQLWYPDENSESLFYTNNDAHGSTLANVCIERSAEDYLEEVFSECRYSEHYEKLSAVELSFLPIILVACRHYRIPVPVHLWRRLGNKN